MESRGGSREEGWEELNKVISLLVLLEFSCSRVLVEIL